MSIKLLKEMLYQVNKIIDIECGVADENGIILACTNESRIGQVDENVVNLPDNNNNSIHVINGIAYQRVVVNSRYEYIVFICSDTDESLKYLSLVALNVRNISSYYDDKFDKSNFIKNVMMNNILPGDIALRAKELHVSNNAKRIVFLIRTEKVNDTSHYEIILSIFPNRNKDFVIVIDEENIALVKELKAEDEEKLAKEIESIARTIVDTLNAELMVKAIVGIGTIVDNIRDIARSYKEAQTALLVGGIFENEKSLVYYNNLGIGRLIYQLPTTLCKLFLKEVFKDNSLERLDSETIHTINKFFENNLNVSETARQLYVHRNTLVYRLDKIQKMTGLDLRMFDDALIFKFSMMVKKYLEKMEKGDVII
ncbi:MAG TPA: PucR family transcriptional regulator [Clostridiaceae bacterium]|nr:PucR family transcriptional regulator [Clostridiaceae bacterium]